MEREKVREAVVVGEWEGEKLGDWEAVVERERKGEGEMEGVKVGGKGVEEGLALGLLVPSA